MDLGFSFGSYFPGESVLHRLDPRTKLIGGAAFIGIALAAQGYAGIAVCALFAAALYAASGIPAGKAARSLAPLLFIAVFASLLNLFIIQTGATVAQVGPIRISEGGVHQCTFIGSRLVVMMAVMSLITLTTTTLDLTWAFERVLSPLARFRFPAHELGMIMGIALRFMPQFACELATIHHAQASRGAALEGSPVRGVRALSSLLVPLFASAFRHADTLSGAMEARCYHGKVGRTRLHPLHFARRDAMAACALAALLACVVATNLLL